LDGFADDFVGVAAAVLFDPASDIDTEDIATAIAVVGVAVRQWEPPLQLREADASFYTILTESVSVGKNIFYRAYSRGLTCEAAE